MCYMWSGHKRMGPDEMARGLANLSWARCTAAGGEDGALLARVRAEKDEMAVWAVSSAALLRSQGKLDEARALLEEHVVAHDRCVVASLPFVFVLLYPLYPCHLGLAGPLHVLSRAL